MSVAMIGPKFYAWDKNGKPLAFGKLYTYQARTNTPKDTYQSEDQIVENSNPVILNGEGYANVYLDGSYKVVLKDSDDNEIWSADPVTAQGGEEWVNCYSATYLSPTTLKVTGNVTEKYEKDRRVRIDNDAVNFAYSTVVSSVFAAGETTITVFDAVVNVAVRGICASIVGPESSVPSDKKIIDMAELNEALNSKSIKEGDSINFEERSTGNGGSFIGDVVLTSSVTNNIYDKIVCVEQPTLTIVLRRKETEDPRRWGAVFDNTADIGPVLNFMLSEGVVPSIPKDQAVINTQVNILEDTCIVFNGSRLKTTDPTLTMFSAVSVDGWSLIGSALLLGTAAGAQDTQIGLYMKGCRRYKVENIISANMVGHSFFVDTDGVIDTRGEHGQISNCIAYESYVGWEFAGGTSAEYTVLTGCSALACVTGVINVAGNTNWNGGNIVDNTIGIVLNGGTNDNHGIFSGVNINHNLEHNLKANDVANGYTFDGCHLYANGAVGSGTGKIEITNSKKIQFTGGQLASPVIINKGIADKNGTVVFRDMMIPEVTWVDFSGDDLVNLVSKGHYNESGLATDLIYPRGPLRVVDNAGFQNGWTDFGSGRAPLAYHIDEDGWVHINGMINGGSTAQYAVVTTLPAGYRPDLTRHFTLTEGVFSSPPTTVAVQIDTSGDIIWLSTGSGNNQVSFDISFPLIG